MIVGGGIPSAVHEKATLSPSCNVVVLPEPGAS